jgi:type I restriction enzyme, S subunit
VKKGDVLITRGSGVTRLVGAAVLVETEPPTRLMICDLIFRVVFGANSEIDPAFLAFLLGTSELRSQIEDQRTGAAPMMQKTTKTVLMGLTFPLPPLPEQEKMVQALTDARTKGAQQRLDASTVRAKAWAAFENAVYSAEVVEEAAAKIAAAS